jgi:hypothetical protein
MSVYALYDPAGYHDPEVALIQPPSPDEMDRDREARDAEALLRAAASPRPTLSAADAREDPDFQPGDVSVSRIRGLLGEGPTWRTLADIPDDPPEPLLLGMLEPNGPTLAYGAPGIGKGMTGAWLITELQRIGMTPAVYDAERRPREWSRRVAGLGGDRTGVVYIEPTDLGRCAGRPLWDGAEALGGIIRESGADILIVDSLLPAVGVGDERLKSDAQAPFLYVRALDSLGIPSLSFGHPPKGQPEGEPFGSMAWLAAMRLTWLGTKAEGEGHHVRWRPRKRNERGHIPGFVLTVIYGDDNRPVEVIRDDDEASTRDWLLAALEAGPRTVAEMADDLLEQGDDNVTEGDRERAKERLSRTLRRLAKDGTVERIGPAGGSKVRWGLAR